MSQYLCMLEVLRVLFKPHLVPSHLDSVCVGGPWGLMARLEVGSGAARKSLPSSGVWPARLQDQQEEATVMMRSFTLPTWYVKEQQESQCWQRGSATGTPGRLSLLQTRVFFFPVLWGWGEGGERVSVNEQLINSSRTHVGCSLQAGGFPCHF